jgi:hypothetical protein
VGSSHFGGFLLSELEEKGAILRGKGIDLAFPLILGQLSSHNERIKCYF